MSKERCESGRIVEAECVRDGGKFVLCNFSGGVSDLFTVRFRAPADYQAGDAFVLRGKELPVLTREMQNAPAGVFRTGAVVHAAIDLACGRIFIGTGGSGGGIGTETDPVYTADKPSLAPLASPTFTGIPKAPTAASGTNTTQLATTEFVNTAIKEADTTPSAFAMAPDYANVESINSKVTNRTWTADRDGYFICQVFVASGSVYNHYEIRLTINGFVMVQGFDLLEANNSILVSSKLYPVSTGDVIELTTTGGNASIGTIEYWYIPPKYIPVNRGYSTDEQLTGETWIDGKPIYKRTFFGTSSTSLATWNTVASFGPNYVDTVVDQRWMANASGGIIPAPFASQNGQIFIVQVYPSDGGIKELHNGSGHSNYPLTITIWYTKK